MGKRLAIIGAGPIGLEAALRAESCGFEVIVYERGRIAENIRSWGHVELFSPFGINHSGLGVEAVRTKGRVPQDDAFLTGQEYVGAYLAPLARAVCERCRIKTQTRVVALAKEGLLKEESLGDRQRDATPFRILLQSADNTEFTEHADIVIDASGTYSHPRWLGSGGIPSPGERDAAISISYLVDDIAGADRERYVGRRILLVGAGFSAATQAVAFDESGLLPKDTRVTWLTRTTKPNPIRMIQDDPLPGRARLATRANVLARSESPQFRRVAGMSIQRIEQDSHGVVSVTMSDAGASSKTLHFDRILANVGYRPDRSIHDELQVHECYATRGPIKLAAALIGSGAVDCLDQASPGADFLVNPEPNFFILGSKSYGTNSSFLIRVGLQQIDQLFNRLSGKNA